MHIKGKVKALRVEAYKYSWDTYSRGRQKEKFQKGKTRKYQRK